MYRYKEETLKLQSEEFDTVDVEIEKLCSVCGRRHSLSLEKITWHQVAAYHCDNGVNFRDTYKFFDICSFKCYLKQVNKLADELANTKTGRIDGMDLSFVRKLLFFYSGYFQ
jgi:hypothetical protein